MHIRKINTKYSGEDLYAWIVPALLCIVFVSFLGCDPVLEIENRLQHAVEQQMIFPLQSEHVHGPTVVELPNGDLLAAWFQGSGERWADDVRIMGSRRIQGDTLWSTPFLMADNPGFPDINPILFMDTKNRLWLMWYVVIANQWESSLPMYRISIQYEGTRAPEWAWQDVLFIKPGNKTERGIQPGDRFVQGVKAQLESYERYLKEDLMFQIPGESKDKLWSLWEGYKQKIDSLSRGENMVRSGRLQSGSEIMDTILGYPLSRRIGWQTKNKPLLFGDRIIVPLYSDGLDCSLFAITDDLGDSWHFSNPVIGGIGIQPTMVTSADGNLHAFLRDNGPPPQRMQHTISEDIGMSWSIAKDSDLPNPGAGFDMINLTSGEWLMVYNHSEVGRNDLSVSISEDEGKSWIWRKQLEFDDREVNATRSHYPAVIQGFGGVVHVVYSFHLADLGRVPHKTIKYASFPVSWVKN